MTITTDLSTDIGKVRLLIPDRVAADAFFSDDEITALLSMEDGIKRATALALETMASSEAYVQKVIKVLDLTTNGAATAKALTDRAAMLRSQADREDMAEEGAAFDIAEIVNDPFSYRERMWNEVQRGD